MSESVQIGYGKSLLEYDTSLPFYVKLPQLKRMPGTPFEEARIAAREIYKFLGAPPVLCLSGGIDSECMALAFLAEDVPFRVATMSFANGLNRHDIEHAVAFCKTHDIPHNLIELDVVRFFKEDTYKKYADEFICHTPELTAQLWFLDQIRHSFVWAAEAFRVFSTDGNLAVQAISEFEAVIHRYVKKRNLVSVPNFHFYSSELAWSFFKESLKNKYARFVDDHDPEFYAQKLQYYLGAGFPVSKDGARFQKLHGFEKVKMYFDTELSSAGTETYISRFRKPLANKYPIVSNTYVDFPKSDEFVKKILDIGK